MVTSTTREIFVTNNGAEFYDRLEAEAQEQVDFAYDKISAEVECMDECSVIDVIQLLLCHFSFTPLKQEAAEVLLNATP